MLRPFVAGLFFALAVSLFSPRAVAHVTLETAQAAPNASYRAVLRVPHGCNGEATKAVRVQMPEGAIDVKPMPKAGWTLATSRGAYAQSYMLYGKPVAEGVREVTWSGGELPDEFYDEFVFRAHIAESVQPGAVLYFPVIQECAGAKAEWTDIPQSGQDAHELKNPAPGLRITVSQNAPVQTATKIGSLLIETPWSRATPAGADVGAGYLRITNTGSAPDRLMSVESSIAERSEIHEMTLLNGVMQMQQLKTGIELKPGETVELKPGGMHIMFMSLRSPLIEGQSFKAVLTFEKAGAAETEFRVAPLGGAGEHEHHH